MEMNEEERELFKEYILNFISLYSDVNLLSIAKSCVEIIYNFDKGYINTWPKLIEKLHFIINKNFQIIYKNNSLFINNQFENESFYESHMKISRTNCFIYDLISSLTERYTFEFRSDPLFLEILDCMQINEVITSSAEFYISEIEVFLKNANKLNSSHCLFNVIEVYLNSLKHIINIAYNFNYQDFPEFYEDNLSRWINILMFSLNLITCDYSKDFCEVGLAAFNMWIKYVSSYYSDIVEYYKSFIDPIWKLLVDFNNKLSNSVYLKANKEKIMDSFIEFYKIIISFRRTPLLEINVEQLISTLVFPNLNATNKELEDLEDNVVNYVKLELQESDDSSSKYIKITLILN